MVVHTGARAGAASPSDSSVNGEKDQSNKNTNATREKSGRKRSYVDDKVTALNGGPKNAERRSSVSKPALDFRDKPEPAPKKKKKRKSSTTAVPALPAVSDGAESSTRSPSPVIDFDGLSRPSRGTRERLEESEAQKEERLERMKGAVRTLLECIGEDPDREGLLATPERYAKAMLFLTKGYQENVRDIVNGAIFQEGHNEMVIVKDIEIFRYDYRSRILLNNIPSGI